jgi:hypothetical protein
MKRVKISAALERQIRAHDPAALDSLVALLDEPAPTKPVPGITAARFVDLLGTHKIAFPSHGESGAAWARLQRRLTSLGLKEDDARIVGAWINGQSWLTVVTLEMLTNKLPEWHTRAAKDAKHAGDYKRPSWASNED